MHAGGATVVHNGEIYNFVELRRELESLGHDFVSGTDTEVVLKGYLQWGVGCVERFDGMFGFAIWDSRKRCLLLARDRLGIKPLYYHRDEDRIVFASEVTALVASGLVPARPNLDELRRGIVLGSNIASFTEGQTMIEDVLAVPPGHRLSFEFDGSRKLVRYWSLPTAVDDLESPNASLPEELIELLDTSVKHRMRADVPVAATLSGGIDSSAIVSLAARQLQHPLTTLTVSYSGGGADPDSGIRDSDEEFARLVATSVKNIDWRGIQIAPQESLRIELLDRIVDLACIPTDPRVAIATATFDAFRELGNTVVLTGEGADELFGGYIGTNFYQHLGRLLGGEVPNGTFFSAACEAGELSRSTLGRLPALYDQFFSRWRAGEESADRRMQRFMILGELPYLLWALDVASMAASVEARVPFLDHRIVEWAYRLPLTAHATKELGKTSLRSGLAGLLPQRVLARPKQTYPLPAAANLRRTLEVYMHEHIAEMRRSPLLSELFRLDVEPKEMTVGAMWTVLMTWRFEVVLAQFARGEVSSRGGRALGQDS